MKTIWLVKDGSPFWGTVNAYLSAVNAKVTFVRAEVLGENIEKRASPDLIITGRGHLDAVAGLPRELSRLVVAEGMSSGEGSRGVYLLRWPALREAFLEMTSRLLYISDRRLFKTVISVSPKGSENIFLGKSMNFSTTGLAFKLDRELSVGDVVVLSFFTPDSEDRLRVEAEVTRCSVDPEDGSSYYGARFLGVKGAVRRELELFINGIRI